MAPHTMAMAALRSAARAAIAIAIAIAIATSHRDEDVRAARQRNPDILAT